MNGRTKRTYVSFSLYENFVLYKNFIQDFKLLNTIFLSFTLNTTFLSSSNNR